MEPTKSILLPNWENLHQNLTSQDSDKVSKAVEIFQSNMSAFNTIQLFEARRIIKLLKSSSKDRVKFKKILDKMDAVQMRVLSSLKANEKDVLAIIDKLEDESLSLERLFALLSIQDNEGRTPVHNPYVAKYLCERIEEFTQDQIFALLSTEDRDGNTPLHNSDVVQYLYESIVQLSSDQLLKFLSFWCSTGKGYALMHNPDLAQHFIEIMKKLTISKLLEIEEKIDAVPMKILSSSEPQEQDILIIMNMLEDVPREQLFTLLSMQDEDGRTPLHNPYVAKYLCERIEEFSQDQIFALLSIEDNDEETPMHNPDVVQYLHESIVQLSSGQLLQFLARWVVFSQYEEYYGLMGNPDLAKHFCEIIKKLPISERLDVLHNYVGIIETDDEFSINCFLEIINDLSEEEFIELLTFDGGIIHDSILVDYLLDRINEISDDDDFYSLLTHSSGDGHTIMHWSSCVEYLSGRIIQLPSHQLIELLCMEDDEGDMLMHSETIRNCLHDGILNLSSDDLSELISNIYNDSEFQLQILEEFQEGILDLSLNQLFHLLPMDITGASMHACNIGKHFLASVVSLSDDELIEFLGTKHNEESLIPMCFYYITQHLRERIADFTTKQWIELLSRMDLDDWENMRDSNIKDCLFKRITELSQEQLLEWLSSQGKNGKTPMHHSVVVEHIYERIINISQELLFEFLSIKDKQGMTPMHDSGVVRQLRERILTLSPERLFKLLVVRNWFGKSPLKDVNHNNDEDLKSRIVDLSKNNEMMAPLFKLLVYIEIFEDKKDSPLEITKSVIPFLAQYPQAILNLVSNDIILEAIQSRTKEALECCIKNKTDRGETKIHCDNLLLICESLRILRSSNCKVEIDRLLDISKRLGIGSNDQNQMLEIVRYFNDSSNFSYLQKDSYLAFFIMKMVFDLMHHVKDPAIKEILKRFTPINTQWEKVDDMIVWKEKMDMTLVGLDIDGHQFIYPSDYLKEKSMFMNALFAGSLIVPESIGSDPNITKKSLDDDVVIPIYDLKKMISNDQINWNGFIQYLENPYANANEFLDEKNVGFLI